MLYVTKFKHGDVIIETLKVALILGKESLG
jgi:hypothetical protein